MAVAEVTGAVDSTTDALIGRLAGRAAIPGHRDGTVYGESRDATRDFRTHHTRVHDSRIRVESRSSAWGWA